PEIYMQRCDVTESAEDFWRSGLEAKAVEQIVRAVSTTRANNRLRVRLSDCDLKCSAPRLCRSSEKAIPRETLVAIQLHHVTQPRQFVATFSHAVLCNRA